MIGFVHEKRPDLAKCQPRQSASPQPPPPQAAEDPVKERLLALVAEKTGYPRDMLDLDLDLEADLGVDTVKQADLFASVRDIYNIPRDANLKLRDFPTLAHVIRFVHDEAAGSATSRSRPVRLAVPARPPPHGGYDDPVKERLLALVAEKTGYPLDMLDLDLDLEADLGVDTVKQADLFASVRAIYNIPRDQNLKLRDFPTLAHVIGFVHENRPDLDIAARQRPAVPSRASRLAPSPRRRRRPIPRRVPTPTAPSTAEPLQADSGSPGPRPARAIMPDKGGVAEASGRTPASHSASKSCCLTRTPPAGRHTTASIGCLRSTRKAACATWTWQAGAKLCGCASSRSITTMRALYEQIATPGTFLISATRLGGQHGYDEAGRGCPAGRRRHRLHQSVQARAARGARQGRRFRGGARRLPKSPML